MIAVTPDLSGIVRPGVLLLDGVRILEHDPRLDALLAESERQVRRTPPPERTAVRAMYRAVGLDPTKRRPSSEALLRRVQRGDALPRINAAVDVGNWCSLEFQLPYGLYDANAVSGPVVMRLGTAGEAYPGIGKDIVHVAGRLTLADDLGPFGNPSSDSARTMVTPATTSLLVVIYGPANLESGRLAEVTEMTARRLLSIVGGREAFRS